MEESNTPLAIALRQYMETSGRSAREISLAVGTNDSLVKAILAGKSKSPRGDTISKLAAEMGRQVEELMPATDRPSGPMPDPLPRGMEIANPVLLNPHPRRDLPVHASAEGGPNGSVIISADPIDYVDRPDFLLNVRNAFACYVVNDSMSPAFDHGDLLLVDPSKPVRSGDDCLLVSEREDGSRTALIKRLVRTGSAKWRVKQFNPAKEFDLDRSDWSQAFRVRGKYRD